MLLPLSHRICWPRAHLTASCGYGARIFAAGYSTAIACCRKCETSGKHANKLTALQSVPVVGFVNSLVFAKSGRFLLAGVGQEHKFGRWSRIPEARNGIQVPAACC